MDLLLIAPFIAILAALIGALISFLGDELKSKMATTIKSEVVINWLFGLSMVIILPALWGLWGYYPLGAPSCEEYDSEPNGGCVSYADNGFEPSSEQRWKKFSENFLQSEFVIAAVLAARYGKTEQNKN